MVRVSPKIRAQQFREKVYQWAQHKPQQNVAYFCMEYGIKSDFPIYSGGLGILAGDTLKSAADRGRPLVAVGLLYRDGYFDQLIMHGRQEADRQKWNPNKYPGIIDLRDSISLPIAGKKVNFRLWGYEVQGIGGNFVPLFLLDSMGASNPAGFEAITSRLYAAGNWERLLQEMALGIGGVRVLEWCGLPIAYYHLNEGHAAFATVELLSRLGKAFENLEQEDFQKVREMFSFTTHTPVPAGFDKFYVEEVEHAFSDQFLRSAALTLGKDPVDRSFVNMALLAMRMSSVKNGVSVLHAEVSEKMFPDFAPIIAVTNGVHHLTWTAVATAELFDKYCPGWKENPKGLEELHRLREDMNFRKDLLRMHFQNKRVLLQRVKKMIGVDLEEDVFTVGFGRRFAAYKRGNLLFQDEDRLLRLAKETGGIQLIFAGKAHPADGEGKGIIAQVIETGNRLTEASGGSIRFAFLPNYNMEIAADMIAGVDVWLNNPLRPHEASGTSGMKASLNGVPNVSIEDGWWAERRGGGWMIGDKGLMSTSEDPLLYLADSASLYRALAEVGRLFVQRLTDPAFVNVMVEAIAGNGSYFNTHRMIEDYGKKVWVPRIVPPLTITKTKEKPAYNLLDLLGQVGKISYDMANAERGQEVEALLAEALIRNLKCIRVTRYDAHNESVRIERRWIGKRFGTIIYEEHESEIGKSGFDHWKTLQEFSGEVMADLLRERKIQIVANPERDLRCYRDKKLTSSDSFVLVPEIVNGRIRGAYKIDFLPGKLKGKKVEYAFLNALMEVVGMAKANLLAQQLREELNGLNAENEVINWALVLMTAGGFVDMPRYAVETNRVAVFLDNQAGELIGARAIGETTWSEYNRNLHRITQDLYKDGVRHYLRAYDQSQASLNLHIKGKNIGQNVIHAPIKVENSIPIFDHREFDGEFNTRKLSQLKRAVEEALILEEKTVEDYLLLPIKGPDEKVYGMVYADNAFSHKPLDAERYIAIIQAAANRIAELRA
jgi:starch phosphorylase